MDVQAIGDYFKAKEKEYRLTLPKDEYAILRLDGRAFHSYTKDLDRPYDQRFMEDMDSIAKHLVDELQGVRLAYVQSDEISLLMTSWSGKENFGQRGELMFGGQVQKLVSISAALAATSINLIRLGGSTTEVAMFDSRAFSVSSAEEVIKYFQWRQKDATVNAITMAAHSVASHKELLNKSTAERAEIAENVELPTGFRRGRIIYRESITVPEMSYVNKATGERETVYNVERTVISSSDAPDFFDEETLRVYIPMKV